MSKIIFILIFTSTFCLFAFSQNSTCPKIFVTGPSSTVQPGETMTFTANLVENGNDLSNVNYQWSVDKGTIIEGQGEPTISVATEGLIYTTITATVEIKGLTSGCKNSDSETGVVSGGDPVTFDDFEKLSRKDEKLRLSALVSELKGNTETKAYIILYHPAKNKKQYESKVLRYKNFLIKDSKISAERIVIVPSGNEPKERTRIYIVPNDAIPPTP